MGRRMALAAEWRSEVAIENRALDGLCALAVAATRGDAAVVTVLRHGRHHVLGAAGTVCQSLPESLTDTCGADIAERHGLRAAAASQALPLSEGFDSALVLPLWQRGAQVGVVALLARQGLGAFTPDERAVAMRLRHLAEAQIGAEAVLDTVLRVAMGRTEAWRH